MRTSVRLLVAVALAAGLLAVPGGAQADHCGGNIVIFSRTSASVGGNDVTPPAVNGNALLCIADPDEEVWEKPLLNAGATQVTVRYTEDWGESEPELQGVLDGLGFEEAPITLVRMEHDLGGWVYDTESIDIPDPTAQGPLTATIILPDGWEESVTFYTPGS